MCLSLYSSCHIPKRKSMFFPVCIPIRDRNNRWRENRCILVLQPCIQSRHLKCENMLLPRMQGGTFLDRHRDLLREGGSACATRGKLLGVSYFQLESYNVKCFEMASHCQTNDEPFWARQVGCGTTSTFLSSIATPYVPTYQECGIPQTDVPIHGSVFGENGKEILERLPVWNTAAGRYIPTSDVRQKSTGCTSIGSNILSLVHISIRSDLAFKVPMEGEAIQIYHGRTLRSKVRIISIGRL